MSLEKNGISSGSHSRLITEIFSTEEEQFAIGVQQCVSNILRAFSRISDLKKILPGPKEQDRCVTILFKVKRLNGKNAPAELVKTLACEVKRLAKWYIRKATEKGIRTKTCGALENEIELLRQRLIALEQLRTPLSKKFKFRITEKEEGGWREEVGFVKNLIRLLEKGGKESSSEAEKQTGKPARQFIEQEKEKVERLCSAIKFSANELNGLIKSELEYTKERKLWERRKQLGIVEEEGTLSESVTEKLVHCSVRRSQSEENFIHLFKQALGVLARKPHYSLSEQLSVQLLEVTSVLPSEIMIKCVFPHDVLKYISAKPNDPLSKKLSEELPEATGALSIRDMYQLGHSLTEQERTFLSLAIRSQPEKRFYDPGKQKIYNQWRNYTADSKTEVDTVLSYLSWPFRKCTNMVSAWWKRRSARKFFRPAFSSGLNVTDVRIKSPRLKVVRAPVSYDSNAIFARSEELAKLVAQGQTVESSNSKLKGVQGNHRFFAGLSHGD